ncbi:hypothetical protein [Corynebacterium sp. A21]|uniref:hypothetical protein n=1 Tax=Corynebacterium sp. A21 TaxID=3457318 RepID=UPI003FD46632
MSAKARTERRKADSLRKAAARTAVKASALTGDTLPRRIYELAGVSIPENATDELQTAK